VQHPAINKAFSTVAAAFNSDLPIHLKPLSASPFNQRASRTLQTDCAVDSLLQCVFTPSFDKVKLKIPIVVLDERINLPILEGE
jgi:hypothetical protein